MLKEELLCNPREENGVVIYGRPWVVDIGDYWEDYLECSCIFNYIKDNTDMVRIIARSLSYENNDNFYKYYASNYSQSEYSFMVGIKDDKALGGLYI